MVTRNPSEAISTFENLKEFNILADQITFNTIVKGLIVNRYYDHIPKLLIDSINSKVFCSNDIYCEAIKALEINLVKSNISSKEFLELNNFLEKNNIFVSSSNQRETENSNRIYSNQKNHSSFTHSNGNQNFGNNTNQRNNKYTNNVDFLIERYNKTPKSFNNRNNNETFSYNKFQTFKFWRQQCK